MVDLSLLKTLENTNKIIELWKEIDYYGKKYIKTITTVTIRY